MGNEVVSGSIFNETYMNHGITLPLHSMVK